MATTKGPKVRQGGLVFGYDTGEYANIKTKVIRGTARNSSGRPSTNYIAHQNAVPKTSYTSYSATSSGTWNAKHPHAIRAYNAQGSDITGYVNTGVGDWTNTYHAIWEYDRRLRKPVVVMRAFDSNWKAKSFGASMGAWSALGMSAGSKYTISWLQWTTHLSLAADAGFYSRNTSNSFGFHDGRSGGNARNTRRRTWQRVYHTFTVNAVRNLDDSYGSVYMYGHTTNNGKGRILKIADVQLEINNETPTAFIPQASNAATGTRTATQGLKNLFKRGSDVNVGNVTYDSTGNKTFNGTDDKIDLGASSQFNINRNVTIECIVKRDSSGWNGIFGTTTGSGFIHWQLNGASINCYLYGPNLAITKASEVTSTSKFYHLAVTFNGTKGILYNNGVEVGSATTTSTADISATSETSIGRVYSADRYFDGKIPVLKVYNETLTATEIAMNYRAYRKRFDL